MKKTDLQPIKDILKDWRPDIRLPIMVTMKVSGLTNKQIAEVFGVSKQAVQQQLERAKK
jgi:predicted RNA polymerase sigma factor